jgi:glucans biosynthesis protein
VTGKRVGEHLRNTGPMMASARCGAKTRSGTPCRSPAVQGKERCRMHGGAKGSGAPPGNRNALKHGLYTREEIAERRMFNRMMRGMRDDLRDFEEHFEE